MKRFFAVFLVMFLGLSLSACNSKPTNEEIAQQLHTNFNQIVEDDTGIAGIVTISDFKKVDGREDGNKYIVEGKYIMTYQKGISDVARELQANMDPFTAEFTLGMLQEMFGEKWTKGERVEGNGEFVFVKTEKSWKLLPAE